MPAPAPSPPAPLPGVGPYKPTIIIHGGAGAITRSSLPFPLYTRYHNSLLTYLLATRTLLTTGASAVTAACHAVTLLEDDELFNCGRGSVFNAAGNIEMEASLAVASVHDGGFEGALKRSAAVSMLRRTRHPILLAREVLGMGDEGGLGAMHGHLSGEDVEIWGIEERGLEEKGPEWFWTERRWEEHLRGLEGRSSADGDDGFEVLPSQGTVGAVCMDFWGNLAVATSTGGLTNKLPGRIGDTPTVGAGFWAESWTERVDVQRGADSLPLSFSERLVASARAEVGFWLGDCVGVGERDRFDTAASLASEKQPLVSDTPQMICSARTTSRKRVVAMSGTGNGDSFLRTNACRTAAAMARFSSPSDPVPLADAVRAVAGAGGELQRSAGDRWGKTGEGEGGIIGVELTVNEDGNGEGKAVFDFNCGGLWRAYFEKDKTGEDNPRIMVFRDEY